MPCFPIQAGFPSRRLQQVGLLLLLFLPTAGFAQEISPADPPTPALVPRCGAYPAMAAWLREAFNEQGVARGLSDDGTLLEIFASRDGTFTALKIAPTGSACIVDVGRGWQLQHRVTEGAVLDQP